MSRTVFKYPINHEVTKLELPLGSKVLMFDQQMTNVDPNFAQANLFIWVEQDRVPNGTQERHFQIIGTGHNIPEEAEYIKSCQQGPFVWHLYERL